MAWIEYGLWKSLVGSGCKMYRYLSTNSDTFELATPFTGEFQMIAAGTSSTGIPATILAGISGFWVDTTDFDDPQWNHFSITATALSVLIESTFDGYLDSYSKDGVWYSLDMGEPSVYALNFNSYSSASLATPITITDSEIFSFEMIGLDIADESSIMYIVPGSSTGSYLFYRGSQSRLRLQSDTGQLVNFTVDPAIIMDGNRHELLFDMSPNSTSLYIDGELHSTASGVIGSFTFDSICNASASGAIFNFAISNVASFAMLTYNTSEVNTDDGIGANSLTYNDLSAPLVESDFTEVK